MRRSLAAATRRRGLLRRSLLRPLPRLGAKSSLRSLFLANFTLTRTVRVRGRSTVRVSVRSTRRRALPFPSAAAAAARARLCVPSLLVPIPRLGVFKHHVLPIEIIPRMFVHPHHALARLAILAKVDKGVSLARLRLAVEPDPDSSDFPTPREHLAYRRLRGRSREIPQVHLRLIHRLFVHHATATRRLTLPKHARRLASPTASTTRWTTRSIPSSRAHSHPGIHSCEYDPLVRNITDSTLPENKTGRLGLGTHTERRSNLIKRQTLARDSRPPHVPRLRLLAVGLDAAFVARGGRRRRGSVGARTVEGDVEIRWRELCASGECHQTSGACATREVWGRAR